MEEAGCEVILDEVVDAEVTDICKKEVKLQLQRIRRDGKKKVDVEKLPDAPGEAGCRVSGLLEVGR